MCIHIFRSCLTCLFGGGNDANNDGPDPGAAVVEQPAPVGCTGTPVTTSRSPAPAFSSSAGSSGWETGTDWSTTSTTPGSLSPNVLATGVLAEDQVEDDTGGSLY